jgi:DNA-binding NtrC family response regulator
MMELAPDVPVIIMTSFASVSSAVEAMKSGAADYISKPFDHDELVMLAYRRPPDRCGPGISGDRNDRQERIHE